MNRKQIIERVAREVENDIFCDTGLFDVVKAVLDAADYFELREAAEEAVSIMCFWRKRWDDLTTMTRAFDKLRAALGGDAE